MSIGALIVFDGDDTLWATEPVYDRARSRIRRFLNVIGVDGARWELVERKLDLDRVASVGFVWHRFPRSCVLALREVEPRIVRPLGRVVELAVFVGALWVFVERPPLLPGGSEVLQDLAGKHETVLLTKGEPWIQRRRVRQSGLRRYFAQCIVVRDKTETTFAALAADSPQARLKISVGNSLASDIAPAISAGFVGVHLHGYMWEHERRPTGEAVAAVTVANLGEARDALDRLTNTARR